MEYLQYVVFLAGGITVAGITFWMNRGRAEQKIDEALHASTIAIAKSELVANNLAEFKTESARLYVGVSSMDKLEHRVTTEMHRISDEMSRRFDELNKTLIEFVASPVSRRRT